LGIVEPAVAFLYLPQTRMVAFADAVEIAPGRIAFQSAIRHKDRDCYVTKSQTAFQSFVHFLEGVHLTVAYRGGLTLTVALTIVATLADEILSLSPFLLVFYA